MLDQASLGKRIQERRKAQGLTQEQLGNELGVSAQAVSKWENGESAPDIGLLPALVQVLGTSADSLLGIDGGIGIETLSEELAKRLGQKNGEAQEAALLQALRRILFAGQEGHGVPGPAGDIRTWYSWEKDRLVGLRVWMQHGFACTVMRGLLDSQDPSPDSLQMLRALIAPGAGKSRWRC